MEALFSASNVGTPAQEFSGKTDRNLRRNHWDRFGGFELAPERARLAINEPAELVDVGNNLPLEQRELRLDQAGLCCRARNVDLARQSQNAPTPCDAQQIARGDQVVQGNRALELGAAQVDVGTRYFTEQRHLDAAPVLQGRCCIRVGCFYASPDSAEEIQFPDRIKAELKLSVGVHDRGTGRVRQSRNIARQSKKLAAGRVLADALPLPGSGGVERWPCCRADDGALGPRFLDAQSSEPQVGICGCGSLYQRGEHRIVEGRPPLRLLKALGGCAALRPGPG